MKRQRASPPATPEEALKGLTMTDGQRNTLISGMLKIRQEVVGYDGLARASPNLKERSRNLKLARTALANLTKAFASPFRNDLIEAADEDIDPPRRISRRWTPSAKRPSVQFLELLPVVKRYIDDMTVDDIRGRWSDDDRRSVNSRRLDYETGAVLDLVQRAGFSVDDPDMPTLELIRAIFAYSGGKAGGTSMARKRIAAWKTPGKQNVYAFHKE
jgi:hypothetical protein